MRVALSMRVVQAENYVEPRDAISHDWIDWLAARGHVPVLVPNRVPDPARLLSDSGAEALILTGGNDLVARGDDTSAVSEQRNVNEAALLAAATERSLPVLGVCRGLHVVNAYCGGRIEPDISGGPVDHVATTHSVRLCGRLSDLLGDQVLTTNSFHGQAVLDSNLGDNLQVFAIRATPTAWSRACVMSRCRCSRYNGIRNAPVQATRSTTPWSTACFAKECFGDDGA